MKSLIDRQPRLQYSFTFFNISKSYNDQSVFYCHAEENQIVIVGMRWNDAVWQAKRNFRKAGKKFKYLEYGSYTNGWRKRLALKMWSGWPTFPMIFIDQKLIGGNSDLRKLLKSDKL